MSFKKKLIYTMFVYPRILKYKFLSNCTNIIGQPKYIQPTQIRGNGMVVFGKDVKLGFYPSPFFFVGYIYIDTRNTTSHILIGNNVHINNNCVLTSEGEGIEIGDNTLIGTCCEIMDSDFHDLHPDRRIGGVPKTGKVFIGKNVFIGANVKILKGVVIGDNTVIANGSVVTKSVPKDVVVGGNPAKILKSLLDERIQ